MRIEAGPHRRNILENGLFTGFCLLGAGLFLYDAYVSYPAKNAPIEQENAERADEPDYKPTPLKHPPDKIAEQKLFAVGFGVLGVVMGYFLIQAKRKRVVLDDEGLHVNNRPVIPFDAMTGLKIDRWGPKGWVDLEYDDGGKTARLRLDSFKIDPCMPIITAICDKKAFPNPIATDQPPDPSGV